ncbi:MAG: hypothetical protein U1F66_03950 [bacterium]
MQFLRRRLAPLALVFLLGLAACGSSEDAEPLINESAPPPAYSKELARQCLAKGDLSCARENYCGIQEGGQAQLRCCLSQFLESYFSENTQALGKMLGYAPKSFAEVRKMPREQILKEKALPFGEWVLAKDVGAKTLLAQYGASLVAQHSSTSELRRRLGEFGDALESASSCLAAVDPGSSEDTLEKEIFSSERSQRVSPRDVKFLEFLSGLLGYAFQAGSAYESGFANFPSLPLPQEFLDDLNGHAGEGDARLGDLREEHAAFLAEKFSLLQASFSALRAFSELKGSPSRIDDYLNWRFPEGEQRDLSGILKAAYLSLGQAEWVDLPDGEWQIHLAALANTDSLPDGRKVDRGADLLSRDPAGEIRINGDLVKAWVSPVLRTKPDGGAPAPKK